MSRSYKLACVAAGVVALIGAGTALADDHGDKLPLYLTKTVDPTAQDSCAPNTMWVGSGIPAANFMLKRNLDAGVELAIKAHLRQGGDIRPTYVDHRGRVHVEVPTGPQPGNPARAAWNFTFSFDAALPGAAPSLDNYDASLWIDLDPSRKTKYLKLKLTKLGPPTGSVPCNERDYNGWGWKAGSTTVIPDDEGTQRVTQNSQNLAFYASVIDSDPNMPGVQPYTFGPGEFDVVLKMKRKGNNSHHDDDNDDDDRDDDKSTTVHVVFNVTATPTP